MFTVTSSGTALTLYELAAPLIVFGLGAGFALSPLLGIILSGVPGQDVGAASGVVSTSMQIGNTVGISLFGLLFYRFLSNQLSSVPISYLDSFKLTLPFLIIPSISSFLIVFLLSQRRTRQIIHRLEA
jgi:predicted MFS family arabinose efflux permease